MNKDYLRNLKKRDPQAYYDLVNDPILVGTERGLNPVFGFIAWVIVALVTMVALRHIKEKEQINNSEKNNYENKNCNNSTSADCFINK